MEPSNNKLNKNMRFYFQNHKILLVFFLLVGFTFFQNAEAALTWTQLTIQGAKEYEQRWSAVALDGDGSNMAIAYQNLFMSNNYGSLWSEYLKGSSKFSTSFAADLDFSADGSVLVLGIGKTASAPLYVLSYSVKDSKYYWKSYMPGGIVETWVAVDVSADGQKIIAASRNNIYISLNQGATWKKIGNTSYNPDVSISDDGRTILIANEIDGVNISRDSGNTWTSMLKEKLPNVPYRALHVAMSADGKIMFVISAH